MPFQEDLKEDDMSAAFLQAVGNPGERKNLIVGIKVYEIILK